MQTDQVIQVYMARARALRPEDHALLTADEKDRAARFHFEKDRRLFVLARCILRSALGKLLDVPPATVPIHLGPNAKPELYPANASWTFNLSHSEDQIAVAIAPIPRVGVDVEFHGGKVDIDSIAREYFCQKEIEYLRGSIEHTRTHFYRFWTLKEAYLKAVGIGLGMSFSSMDMSGVPVQASGQPEFHNEDDRHGIRVQSLPAPARYSGAVAADGSDWHVEVVPWSWESF